MRGPKYRPPGPRRATGETVALSEHREGTSAMALGTTIPHSRRALLAGALGGLAAAARRSGDRAVSPVKHRA
jgi:hypothetical protein